MRKAFFLIALQVSLTFFPAALFAETNTAVVIVDMQPLFLQHARDSFKQKLIDANIDVLRWANEHGHAVLVFEFAGYGDTIADLSDVYKTNPRVRVFQKRTDGGFDSLQNTVRPETVLADWGIEQVIMTGVNGPFCVRSTAEGALRHNFKVLTSADVVANLWEYEKGYPNANWWLQNPNFFPFLEREAMKACESTMRKIAAPKNLSWLYEQDASLAFR